MDSAEYNLITSQRGHEFGGLSKVRRQERINGGWQRKMLLYLNRKC